MRSMYGKLKTILVRAPATAGSGDATSSTIDMQGFTSCMITVMAGIFNFTSTNKLEIQVNESDDGTVFTKVASSDMENLEDADSSVHRLLDASATDASSITELHYKGTKRYLHVFLNESGTVAVPLAIQATMGDLHMKPSVD